MASQRIGLLRKSIPLWLEDGSISKADDSHLRTLLVHGARPIISNAKNKSDRISQWVQKLAESRHHNVVTIALANKNARIAWALLTKEQTFQAR